jgi:hypothetical protein
MKTVLLSFLLFSFVQVGRSADEGLKIEPGLWQVKMVISNPEGSKVDPAKAINEALAKLPEEKKKKMMESLGNVSAAEDEGMKVCYTEQMLKELGFMKQDKGRCESVFKTKTPTLVKLTFTCKDGITGDGVWTVKNPKFYAGAVTIIDAQKKKTTVNYTGSFLEKDCGNLKPPTL